MMNTVPVTDDLSLELPAGVIPLTDDSIGLLPAGRDANPLDGTEAMLEATTGFIIPDDLHGLLELDDVAATIQLGAGQVGAILVEHEGLFEWAIAPNTAREINRARRLSLKLFKRSGRGSWLKKRKGKFLLRVYKWAMQPVAGAITKAFVRRNERNKQDELLHVVHEDGKARLRSLTDTARLNLPSDRPAKVLLLIHGTFASVRQSYKLMLDGPGFEYLQHAWNQYDAVIGYDHRTLSKSPRENAQLLDNLLKDLEWPHPPKVDVVTTSRGAMVARAWFEQILPDSDFNPAISDACMIAPALGGTLLLEDDNWEALVDNMIKAASCLTRLSKLYAPAQPAAQVIGHILRASGAFVAAIAADAITRESVPGLAAMNPTGPVLAELNNPENTIQSASLPVYHRVTSDFEFTAPNLDELDANLSARALLGIADLAIDGFMDGQKNDLVVDNASADRVHPAIRPALGAYLQLDRNSSIHHLNFFLAPQTRAFLRQVFGSGPDN